MSCAASVPGYAGLSEEMARWKEEAETSWLMDAPSQPLPQSRKNLKETWDRHFQSLKKLKAGKIKPNQLAGVYWESGKDTCKRF